MQAVYDFDGYQIRFIKDRYYEISKKTSKGIPKVFLNSYAIDMHYALYFISMFFKTRVQIIGFSYDNESFIQKFTMNKDFKVFERSKFSEVFSRMLSMNKEILITYLNSCSAYNSAVTLSDSNHSVAFLLLAIAIESLSNKYYSSGKYGEKFRKLIADFLPTNRRFLPSELKYVDRTLNKEEEKSLFEGLLTSVYGRIRSGFVHFGEGSPATSMVGDVFKLAYVKTHRNGEKLDPSFVWFKRLVEEILVNFLFSQRTGIPNDLFSLVSERFISKLKARRAIKKGELITPEDVYLQ